jgi:hypothetical protein
MVNRTQREDLAILSSLCLFSGRQARGARRNSPITLEYMMVKDHTDAREVEHTGYHKRIEDIVPSV